MTSLHTVTLCLLLVALACTASLLQRVIRIPLPFVQIAVGAVAALPPFGMTLPLDPDTFLLLFLPLLLFGDGWRLPRRGLSAMPWSVLGYAVGLVLLTTLVGGYALHWLIPEMPLSVAFAVAALVSPTDAVAVAGLGAGGVRAVGLEVDAVAGGVGRPLAADVRRRRDHGDAADAALGEHPVRDVQAERRLPRGGRGGGEERVAFVRHDGLHRVLLPGAQGPRVGPRGDHPGLHETRQAGRRRRRNASTNLS